jgi:hypothetical protein
MAVRITSLGREREHGKEPGVRLVERAYLFTCLSVSRLLGEVRLKTRLMAVRITSLGREREHVSALSSRPQRSCRPFLGGLHCLTDPIFGTKHANGGGRYDNGYQDTFDFHHRKRRAFFASVTKKRDGSLQFRIFGHPVKDFRDVREMDIPQSKLDFEAGL